MKCLLVFDYTNDIVFSKYDEEFGLHINAFAASQCLIKQQEASDFRINSDILVQIFSPIVTSQRIMSCQFGNSYTSIQCEDDLNITLEESMGYLFVAIGHEDTAWMKRFLKTCITLSRYLCGPDTLLLKSDPRISTNMTNLIDNWIYLHHTEQSILVEAVEQLIVNSDLSSAALQALREAVDKLQSLSHFSKLHAMVFVRNKFLALYSSRHATTLSPCDTLFLNLLCNAHNTQKDLEYKEKIHSYESVSIHKLSSSDPLETFSYQVLLTGNECLPKCTPHIVHVTPLAEGVNLLFVIETGNIQLSSSLYNTFFYLNAIQTVQMQRDVDTLKPTYENLDTCAKKLIDSFKKAKIASSDSIYRDLVKKWEYMRKKYCEFIKGGSNEALLRVESCTTGLLDTLKSILTLTARNDSSLYSSQAYISDIAKTVDEKLKSFNQFFVAKSLRNFSLGSRDSLTINKYLEEFPGLVHFLYIDRTNHRITTPTLDFSSVETINLTKKKIWFMVDFSRRHLQEGHLSFMWKDSTFSYAYFLWFEDNSGTSVKPAIFPTNASKVLPQPGLLCRDFYQKLKEICFPKLSPNKLKCYELFCIHLGLATFSCVLEQTRRLAATIWELRGHPNHPIDLL